VADRGFSGWELASVGVESDGALGVIIFESFWFGETEGNLRGRVVGQVLLDVLVRNKRDFTHAIKFIITN
jgi:hypothetical protein